MQRTRAQIQLQYHQTLNRICEMELLAEQLSRLARSYMAEEHGTGMSVKESGGMYLYARAQDSPGATLQEQAEELKAAAEDWYRQAREEYHTSLEHIRKEEERQRSW